MSLNFYFDEAKKMLDIERDAVLARKLDITPQELNVARKKGWCNDGVLVRLAELTGTQLEILVLAREASKTGKFQPIFVAALERAKQAGAIAGIGAIMILSAAGNVETANAVERNSVVFITGNKRKVLPPVSHFFRRFFDCFLTPTTAS